MAVTIMKMNLRGEYFEVNIDTLQRSPYSRLARLSKGEEKVPLDGKGCYFYDRNPSVFHAILDFYSTGILDIPSEFAWSVVKEELEFWQIDLSLLSPQCLVRYKAEQDFLKGVEAVETYWGPGRWEALAKGAWFQGLAAKCRKVWTFLEMSKSSKLALVYAIVMYVILPFVSVFNAMVMTAPRFSQFVKHVDNETGEVHVHHRHEDTPQGRIILLIEVITVSIFALETFVRFIVWPSKLRFFSCFLNWWDILGAFVPLQALFLARLTHHKDDVEVNFKIRAIHFMMGCIAFRMFRFFRLWRCYDTYRILMLAIKYTIRHFYLTFTIFYVFTILFGLFIYMAEAHLPDTKFIHALRACYFAAVTMTTVGYGDVLPTSPRGKNLATMCSGLGILMIALPIPALVSNYSLARRQVHASRELLRASEEKKRIVHVSDIGKGEGGPHLA